MSGGGDKPCKDSGLDTLVKLLEVLLLEYPYTEKEDSAWWASREF